MRTIYEIGIGIQYFRRKCILNALFSYGGWNSNAKLCDLMCCIAYDKIMKGEY